MAAEDNYKNRFVRGIEEALVGRLSADDVTMVADEIIKALSGYDLIKSCTDIVVYDNVNEATLDRYCACLMIDGKSEKTIAQYRRTIIKLFEIVNKPYTDIGVYDIRLFLAYDKQRGVSNRTLENTRVNLSAFFQWLTQEELIGKNPCMGIKPIRYTDKVRLPLSNIEIDSLRFACNTPKERALIEMLLATGVRVSELVNIRIEDIDFENRSVHITKGKGSKERTVYFNDLARLHLQNYLLSRKEHGTYLFYNKKHEQLNAGGVRHILNVIADRAHVTNVHPHRFRRTFASGLAYRGMDIQEIRKLLGHSNINTTMEYVYTSDSQVQTSYIKYAT